MEEAKKVLDEVIKTLTTPQNATLSQSFKAYNDAVECLQKSLKKSYEKGYRDCENETKKRKLENQIKNN